MITPRWPDQELQKQRSSTDPLADRYIAEMADSKSEKELYLFMRMLLDEFSFLTVDKMDARTG